MARLLWLLAPMCLVGAWRRTREMGAMARVLRMAGLTTLVVGASFVHGAAEEEESEAAAMGTRVFGIAGAAMVLASSVLNRACRKAA